MLNIIADMDEIGAIETREPEANLLPSTSIMEVFSETRQHTS